MELPTDSKEIPTSQFMRLLKRVSFLLFNWFKIISRLGRQKLVLAGAKVDRVLGL